MTTNDRSMNKTFDAIATDGLRLSFKLNNEMYRTGCDNRK